MKKYINKFWRWYEANLKLSIGIAAFLFVWQLFHLFWLSTDVVAERLVSFSLFNLTELWELLVIAIDYGEIPAIVTVSLVYVNELRKGISRGRNILYLILLNSQWFHIFWITDEFVVSKFRGVAETILPLWLAWVAVGIDYLELPVMYDTISKFFTTKSKKK